MSIPAAKRSCGPTGRNIRGGLAQHLAYFSAECDVRRTVAFDPSPATGWLYLYWRERVHTKDPDIARVYLDGEALRPRLAPRRQAARHLPPAMMRYNEAADSGSD